MCGERVLGSACGNLGIAWGAEADLGQSWRGGLLSIRLLALRFLVDQACQAVN